MLAAMFSGRHNLDTDKDGNYFIDRNGKYFEHILDFLRNDQYLPPRDLTEAVLEEAEYYGLIALVEILKTTPPLFPTYPLREELRRAVVNYDRLKKNVMSIAGKDVLEKAKIKSTTDVFILYYTIIEAGMGRTGSKTVFSFQEVLSWLVNIGRVEDSVFLNTDDAKDATDVYRFIDVLLYDLKKAGYNIGSPKYSGYCNSFSRAVIKHSAEFNGKIFIREFVCTLTFSWPSQQIGFLN